MKTGSAPNMPNLYCNPDEGARWREIRKASKAWRSRDKKLLELSHRARVEPCARGRAR